MAVGPSLCYSTSEMADQRAQMALGRLEAAFDRIEVAVRRRADSASQDHARSEPLRAAHEKLRREVGSAIAELDELIAGSGSD
jgi:hypothetical protein